MVDEIQAVKEENTKLKDEINRMKLAGSASGPSQVEAPKEITPLEYSKLALQNKLPVKK